MKREISMKNNSICRSNFFLDYYNILYPSLIYLIFSYMDLKKSSANFEFYAHFMALSSMISGCCIFSFALVEAITHGNNQNKGGKHYFIGFLESMPTLLINVIFVMLGWNIIGYCGLILWFIQLFFVYRKK